MSVLVAASILLSGGCLDLVDDRYIAGADDIFVGIPSSSEDGIIGVELLSALRSTNVPHEFGARVSLPGRATPELGWREVSALVEHRDEGYLESGAYYPGVVVGAWDEACEPSYSLTIGVRYLFIIGDEARLRSVEPITSDETDPWFRHVKAVLEAVSD